MEISEHNDTQRKPRKRMKSRSIVVEKFGEQLSNNNTDEVTNY